MGMRVPEIVFPEMPQPASPGGDAEDRAKEKELHAAWIISMLKTARNEFSRLQSIAGSSSALSHGEFRRAVQDLGVRKATASARLFNAFGSKSDSSDLGNRCGCAQANASSYFSEV